MATDRFTLVEFGVSVSDLSSYVVTKSTKPLDYSSTSLYWGCIWQTWPRPLTHWHTCHHLSSAGSSLCSKTPEGDQTTRLQHTCCIHTHTHIGTHQHHTHMRVCIKWREMQSDWSDLSDYTEEKIYKRKIIKMHGWGVENYIPFKRWNIK